MKKIKLKISLLIILVAVFASCEDNLEQVPVDEYETDEPLSTAQDFENGLRGVYQQLISGYYYGGLLLSVPDVASDNTTLSQYGRGTKDQYHNWTYNPSSTQNLSGLYNQAYFTIDSVNIVLSYGESYNGENKAEIIAELKAIRALAHFDIVKNFGEIPTQSSDANTSPGIAYVTEADPDINSPRETVGAVYDKIVQDLIEARADISDTPPVGRLSKEAVNLLLSRVYLYMGKWQDAIDAANEVTTQVAPISSVVGVWEDTNQDGLVFYIPNESADNNIGVQWSQGSLEKLIPEYVASFELVNLYADDDIRKEAYIAPATTGTMQSVNAIKKLLGRYNNTEGMVIADGVVDFKILRASEAYLNKAEALFNLGGRETEARAALDEVRTKRYTSPPSGETGTALRYAIRLERRLEFAFEYQRFYDLKRMGLSIVRDGKGDKADGTGIPSFSQELAAWSYKFQLPIDQSIIDRNYNTVQNPGY